MANEEELAMKIGHGANTSISYNIHSYTGGPLVVIPLKRAFRGGSKSSREVVVHTKVVELDGSVTRVFGDGSGSSGTRSFSERYLTSTGSTVEVHTLSGYLSVRSWCRCTWQT